jgi:hypothetical protein
MRWTLPLLFLAALAAAATWDGNLCIPRHLIGGPTGVPFTIVGQAGTVVTKIRVHRANKDADTQFLRGIKIYYSDGTSASAGRLDDEYNEFEFQGDERITSMTLWGNGIGTRTGRIRFNTDKGNEFSYGQDTSGQDEFAMEIGSGILIGFAGNEGFDIDKLGPIFLKPLKDIRVENVKYPKIKSNQGLSMQTLKQSEATWNGEPYKFTFRGAEERMSTTTWNFKFATSLAVGIKVMAGIPLLGEAGIETTWTTGIERENGRSESKKTTLSWETVHEIKGAGDAIRYPRDLLPSRKQKRIVADVRHIQVHG